MYYREENKLQFVNTEFCMSLARAYSLVFMFIAKFLQYTDESRYLLRLRPYPKQIREIIGMQPHEIVLIIHVHMMLYSQ